MKVVLQHTQFEHKLKLQGKRLKLVGLHCDHTCLLDAVALSRDLVRTTSLQDVQVMTVKLLIRRGAAAHLSICQSLTGVPGRHATATTGANFPCFETTRDSISASTCR